MRAEGQALYHLLFRASLDGLIVRGPMVGKQHAYVLVRDWIGEAKPVDRDEAMGEFTRRYLAGHGPASERDLARWAGIPLRDVRRGLEAIAPELDELDGGLVDLRKRTTPAELPPPKLLGTFEPVLLGWISRELIYGDDRSFATDPQLLDPLALVKGRAVAHWRLRDGEVELEPFAKLTRAHERALDEEAEAVVRFLG